MVSKRGLRSENSSEDVEVAKIYTLPLVAAVLIHKGSRFFDSH